MLILDADTEADLDQIQAITYHFFLLTVFLLIIIDVEIHLIVDAFLIQ